MVNCLIYVISPTHVISSCSALKTLHGNRNIQATVLVHWPGVADMVVNELSEIIQNMSRKIAFIKNTKCISSNAKASLLAGNNLQRAIGKIRNLIGDDQFDEIYYAHDIEGGMFQLLCTAYPEAQRVCYGDALGNVYEKNVHLSFLKGQVNEEMLTRLNIFVKRSILELLNKIRHRGGDIHLPEFRPHKAALILPVDQSGLFLKDIPLTVCRKSDVVELLDQCISSCPDLHNYIATIISTYPDRQKHLLLTDNFAEGNFIDFEHEIDMYCALIKRHCTPGGVVFLKSHPGETLPRNKKIMERLKGSYEVVELNATFKRYPVELWKELVLNSTVICMSYPTLSLKYLYDVDVIQPMDDAFIEHWFPEWTWASYKNAIALYMEPLKNLASWDGTGVLWAGNIQQQV